MMTNKPKKASAYQEAINILSRRQVTAYQLDGRLQKKGYDQHEIDSVIAKLIAWNYLNDLEYALAFSKSRSGKYSRSRIKRELLQAGVAPGLIENALEDTYTEAAEYQNCLRLAQKFLQQESAKWLRKSESLSLKPSGLDQRRQSRDIEPEIILKKKIADRLLNRGYSVSTVLKAVTQLMEEKTL